jgi:phosphatidylserine/phosphatidylglycerophosphate/cardiolipin synthase-like enzyme
MRRGHVLAVSSATLFLSTVIAPYHVPGPFSCASAWENAGPGVVISEFYPCGLCDDEYIVLENSCDRPVDLSNWTVTDGEGSLRFCGPLELGPGERLVVASNSTSYRRAFDVLPDLCLDDPGSCPPVIRSGTFRLADVGDSIVLYDHRGTEVDFVGYGACTDSSLTWMGGHVPALRKGEVAKRIREGGSVSDTDSAADWLHFREFRYGYTDLQPLTASVAPGLVTAFASPDCGLATVLEEIGRARQSVKVCGYELSSSQVCSALLSVLAEGVEVEILVDGAPAGGMSDDEVACLSALAASGATVNVLLGKMSEDAVQHVGPLHAKYMVVDDLRLVALSENFVESGLPSDPLSGNRGWGLVVTSPELAGYVGRVFDSDSRGSRPDVRAWADDPRFDPRSALSGPEHPPPGPGMMGARTTSSASVVTVLPSPDCSLRTPFLCELMGKSTTLLVEQFQADLLWKDRWTGESHLSPLLSSVEGALLRGAQVSFLLDSSWFNIEDNGEVAEHINSLASSQGLLGEARMMDLSGPVSTLHNKGLVADGRLTLVSSNNWGYSSFARNRELAVLVESEEVAEYFSSAFGTDWDPDREPPVADAGPDAELVVGESLVLDGRGSLDDRAVARWEWRLEGDGLLTDLGSTAVYTASRPGEHKIHLLVQDAWGNTDSDTVIVVVTAGPGHRASLAGPWLLSSAVLMGAASSAVGAAAARKLNHRNRSSP